jgi:hypothetical protein
MFQPRVGDEIRTRILFSLTPLLPENRAFYQIMYKNVVELGRP